MDRPIHLEALTIDAPIIERSNIPGYALRNTLRRNPTIISIGETTDAVTTALAKKAGAAAAARAAKGY
jgi:hypothetical protein